MRVLVAPRAGNPDTWAENDVLNAFPIPRLGFVCRYFKSYGGGLKNLRVN
jgi:hypothetical protein